MKRLLINLTDKQIEELNEMIKKGFYKNRAEAIRDSVKLLIENKKLIEIQKITKQEGS